MESYLKKILISVLAISVLSFILLLGIKYGGNNLASLFDVIVARVTINPLKVNVSAPAEVQVDKVFKVTAKLINKGGERIENAKGEIFLPADGLVLFKKDSVQEIKIIPPKREKKISWLMKGEKIGNHVITVSGWGELRGYGVFAEDSINIEVKESLKRTQPQILFQTLFDFIRGWFGYK